MPFQTYTLPNGLQLLGETIPTARSTSVGFYVVTGSRDETPEEGGVSHFLEHMMFKGTPRRTALQVNLDFDKIGANYNAYTSEEVTAYYAAVLPEYLPTGIDILADILRPSLREEDFATEKQVILEEIKMYEDNPGSMAWDKAKQLYFGSHPLGNSILGTSDGIRGLTRDRMHAYFERRYAPGNVVVAAAGNFDWAEFVDLVAQKCGQWTGPKADRGPTPDTQGERGRHHVTKDGTQQHYLLMSRGPSAESPARYAASVLSTALGDDTGSRIYWELVDPGHVESAGAMTDQAVGTGLVVTSFSSDPDKAPDNLATLERILKDVQDRGVTADEVEQAKNKIASRVVRGNERPMGRMRSIAGAWLYNREYADVDTELARFDAVDVNAIRDCLAEYPLDAPTVVGYGPLA